MGNGHVARKAQQTLNYLGIANDERKFLKLKLNGYNLDGRLLQQGNCQKLWSFPKFSPSSIVSGRIAPSVSGNKSPTIPPTNAKMPKIVNGRNRLMRAFVSFIKHSIMIVDKMTCSSISMSSR